KVAFAAVVPDASGGFPSAARALLGAGAVVADVVAALVAPLSPKDFGVRALPSARGAGDRGRRHLSFEAASTTVLPAFGDVEPALAPHGVGLGMAQGRTALAVALATLAADAHVLGRALVPADRAGLGLEFFRHPLSSIRRGV